MSGKIKSIRGPIGPPGPPGIRGSIGNTGPTGPAGPIGQTGVGAISAISETGSGVFNFFPDGNTAGIAANKWDQPFIFDVKNISSTRIRPLNNLGNSVTSDNSTVAGGVNNTINGIILGFIGGGTGNMVSATGSSIVGGISNTIESNSDGSIIGGGMLNKIAIDNTYCGIFSGSNNSITNGPSKYQCIVSGKNNVMNNSEYSIINGGKNNTMSSCLYGIIEGGNNNINQFSSYTSIINGVSNRINQAANSSSIIGGKNNTFTLGGRYGSILGGELNRMEYYTYRSSIIGGDSNTIRYSNRVCILSGFSNFIGTGVDDSIVSGRLNTMINSRRCIISGVSNNIGVGAGGIVYNSGIICGTNNNIFSSAASLENSIIIGGDDNGIVNSNRCIISGRINNSIGVNDVASSVINSGIVAGRDNIIGNVGTNRSQSVICGGSQNTIDSNRGFIAAATLCTISGVNDFAIIGANNRTATGLATGPGLLTENLHFINQFMFSDEREKDNIIRLSDTKFDPVLSIKRIEPISFNWKDKNVSDRQYGFSAQNCEAVLPWTTNKQRLVRLEYIPEEDMYKNIENEERFNGSEYLIQSSPGGPFLITNMNNDEGVKTIKPTSIQALTMMGLKKLIERVEYLEGKVEELLKK